MESRIAELNRIHDADAATVAALQERKGTVPTLPAGRLDKLFTAHGIMLGRLTGVADLNPATTGDEGIKVYVVPTDASGEPLKAAGSFVVEAFDLNKPSDNLVGRWSFSVDDARKSWYGRAMLYTYVLTCPWQRLPEHESLTLKVTFHDELTGRTFEAQKVIAVKLH